MSLVKKFFSDLSDDERDNMEDMSEKIIVLLSAPGCGRLSVTEIFASLKMTIGLKNTKVLLACVTALASAQAICIDYVIAGGDDNGKFLSADMLNLAKKDGFVTIGGNRHAYQNLLMNIHPVFSIKTVKTAVH